MSDRGEFEELLIHLVRASRLSRQEATHIVNEVLSFLDELPEDFVRRRHRVLQDQGLSNDEIFARLKLELAERRFRAAAYSARQIRRMIYG